MAYQIIAKKRFNDKLVKVLTYLEIEWGKKTAATFLEKLDLRLATLKHHPYIGAPSNKFKSARGIHVTKHNRMYYKIHKNSIILLNLYDTRQKGTKTD